MDNIITTDIKDFRYRELAAAGELLTSYVANPILGNSVELCFNRNSGNVFLVDEDGNCVMTNGDKLERFYSCWYCAYEGFKEGLEAEDHIFDFGGNNYTCPEEEKE